MENRIFPAHAGQEETDGSITCFGWKYIIVDSGVDPTGLDDAFLEVYYPVWKRRLALDYVVSSFVDSKENKAGGNYSVAFSCYWGVDHERGVEKSGGPDQAL